MEKIEYYENNDIVSQYCEFHFGEEYFGVKNFPLKIVDIVNKYAIDKDSVLDIGCSVGRVSFELSNYFNKVVGIDYSQSFIDTANRLKENGVIRYEKKIEGDIKKHKEFRLENIITDNVEFHQGDACDLDEHYKDFSVIVAINLIDRLHTPKDFLNDIAHRLKQNGIFIIASPFTWSEEHVKKEHWVGGKFNDGEIVRSIDALKKILDKDFEPVCEPFDEEFVIQEHSRKYQHSLSTFSIWKKRA